jgi:GNAT superfamily N-acetyltransferase
MPCIDSSALSRAPAPDPSVAPAPAAPVSALVTTTLAALSPSEARVVRACSMPTGVMRVMMDNLARGTLRRPEEMRLTMRLTMRLGRGQLLAWLLVDCAGEYNPLRPEACSLQTYTAPAFRRRGVASRLLESQAASLRELGRPLLVYCGSRRSREFYSRLGRRVGLELEICRPVCYRRRRARADAPVPVGVAS